MKTGEYNGQCTCQLCQPNWVFSEANAAMVPMETPVQQKPADSEQGSLQRFLSTLPAGAQVVCN